MLNKTSIKKNQFNTNLHKIMILSNILSKVKPSATIAVSMKAEELKSQGKNIISLSMGEPDFDTPQNIKDAAIKAINEGDTKYTAVNGTLALKKAIIGKLKRDNELDYQNNEIIVSVGAKHVIYNALVSSLNPGDEVIIPAPYWVSYPDMVLLCQGSPVILQTLAHNNFKINPQDLAAKITNKTKWIILNSPSNPTGSCYSKSELRELADILLKYPQVNIMSDDIYEHLIFDNLKFSTIAQIEPKLKERTLIVNGVSKAYAMTGWRIGYGAGNKDLIKAMSMIQSQSTSCPTSISQAASVEALNGNQGYIPQNANIFQSRRDMVVEMLNNIDGISCNKPNGAFYVFPSCQDLIGKKTPNNVEIKSDTDFATYILEESLVAIVPGSAFGSDGFFRISYAAAENFLKDAINRIESACKKLK